MFKCCGTLRSFLGRNRTQHSVSTLLLWSIVFREAIWGHFKEWQCMALKNNVGNKDNKKDVNLLVICLFLDGYSTCRINKILYIPNPSFTSIWTSWEDGIISVPMKASGRGFCMYRVLLNTSPWSLCEEDLGWETGNPICVRQFL